jgi:magnesium-protoporphyrin IX monomethyl ester (oxidative) cyclase
MRDIPLVTHLAPPTGVYPVMFVRNSQYYETPDDYGLDLQPQDFYALTYPFEPSAIRAIANHFVDRNSNADELDQWLEWLNEKVSHWRARWLGADGRPQARLCRLEGDTPLCVYDSRTGEEIRHEVSAVAQRILEHLERPAGRADVARALHDVPGDVLESEMDSLVERGWLFEEQERYLSLVVM